MGRFYADLNRLKNHASLTQSNDRIFAALVELYMMSPVDNNSKNQSTITQDRDGDILMAEPVSASPPISPFKEKFGFEWFSFDGNKHSSTKATLFSPVSPVSRKLSISTASPTSYFSDHSASTSDSASKLQNFSFGSGRRPRTSQLVLPPPPSKPLQWIWQCHMCRNRYPLAVTRRCLVDGHYYCSGVTSTSQRNAKRRKAKRSCTSEFDYVGWQDWGRWTRKCKTLKTYAEGKENGPVLQGCESCSFPSQCRYESRPKQEKLEFGDYIDDKEIDIMLIDEVEELISPERRAFEEERLSRPRQVSRNATETTPKGPGSSVSVPRRNASQLEAQGKAANSTMDKTAQSKHQRFYSGFANSLSGTTSNPTRDVSEKGKFDPTLPSLSAPSSPPRKASGGEPETLAAALKSVLASQTSAAHPGVHRSQSLPEVETITSKNGSRKRSNSIIDDPGYEGLVSDAARNSESELVPKPSRPASGLLRTNSEQSLITDLFRQVKGGSVPKDKTSAERANQAASEADIAEFLQLRSPRDSVTKKAESKPITIDPVKTTKPFQHFEDIQLTPKEVKPGGIFDEVLMPRIVADTEKPVTDPVKRDTATTPSAHSASVEKTPTATFGGGLFNFGFGRK